MGSTPEFADYVFEQLADAGELSKRRMFGEYALYLDDKVVGFICDDQLFVKPTPAGLDVLDGDAEFAPAYPGSKDYVLVTFLEDHELAAEFVRVTASALPAREVKPPKAPRTPR